MCGAFVTPQQSMQTTCPLAAPDLVDCEVTCNSLASILTIKLTFCANRLESRSRQRSVAAFRHTVPKFRQLGQNLLASQ